MLLAVICLTPPEKLRLIWIVAFAFARREKKKKKRPEERRRIPHWKKKKKIRKLWGSICENPSPQPGSLPGSAVLSAGWHSVLLAWFGTETAPWKESEGTAVFQVHPLADGSAEMVNSVLSSFKVTSTAENQKCSWEMKPKLQHSGASRRLLFSFIGCTLWRLPWDQKVRDPGMYSRVLWAFIYMSKTEVFSSCND